MKKKIAIGFTLCAAGAAIALALSSRIAVAQAPGGKNLQVLPKTMSKDEIKKVMKAQSKALGVECDHCHDQADMAKDTDNKKVAREFMKAVAAFNQTMFKGKPEVTCMHCHRGKVEPKL